MINRLTAVYCDFSKLTSCPFHLLNVSLMLKSDIFLRSLNICPTFGWKILMLLVLLGPFRYPSKRERKNGLFSANNGAEAFVSFVL